MYAAKKKAEQERFRDVLRWEDDRAEVFKIAKQMTTKNHDVIGEKCVRNNEGKLAFEDSEKHAAWKEYYEKLLNEEFGWDRENLVLGQPVEGPPPQIQKEWVKAAINKMKDGKAGGSSGVVAEMLKASGDIGLDLVTELINCIVREGCIPKDWQTSVIVNCFKGKGDALECGNYRGLKLLDHVMKVFERVIEKLIWEKLTLMLCSLVLCQERVPLMLSSW